MTSLEAALDNLAELVHAARNASTPEARRSAISAAWFSLMDAQDANNALLRTAQEIETEMMP